MKVQHVDPGVAHVLEKPPVDALLARLLRSDGGKNGAHLLAGGTAGLFVRVVRQQRRDLLLHRRQLPRQRPQDQAAMDAAVGVDLVDQVKQLLPPHR